ncbi:hypothetical protein G7Z17_g905 [Cylindrodendrum hubeiense]|uniref:AB hydrolase-1 domain-containing protein n=1 Tax=Cylindrodendrum hubeiense TaxID=595255 RepID=A0A9P5LMJ9_9HYPO|nr:hypothetical protein G7Z17_g905 [Cylindrodendrum hubeiense]
MSQKPSIVFVPGAWHIPETWGKVTTELEAHQYKCAAVALPTTLSASANFADDVKAVQDKIVAETSQGRNVVVVTHSYGGAVGASALKGLTLPKTGASTESGHVIGFMLIASGFMVTGVTFLEGLGGKPPPIWKEDTDTGLAVFTVDPRDLFYHDLPEEEGKYWVEKLQNQSMKAFTEGYEAGYAGWKDVPVWYLATTDDHSHPLEVQKHFVKIAQDDGGDVTIREIDSSHSPMLSKPKETADIIIEAATAFTR